jgi:hypothetical protein
MVTIPQGKCYWIWQANQALSVHGTPAGVADAAVAAGLSEVIFKTSNGWYPWLPDKYEARGLPETMKALADAGIRIWVYHYSYAISRYEPKAILDSWLAYSAVADLAGLIVNAESEYKKSGTDSFAIWLLGEIRDILPGVPVGMTSYRYPELHQEFPWAAWFFGDPTHDIKGIDFYVPQVYWQGAHNPAWQLRESLRQIARIDPTMIIVPAGSAYRAGTWRPTIADVDEFDAEVRRLEHSGISWWRYDTAVTLGLWDAIAKHPWPTEPPAQGKHWDDLIPEEKDEVLMRTAQVAGTIDDDGFVIK